MPVPHAEPTRLLTAVALAAFAAVGLPMPAAAQAAAGDPDARALAALEAASEQYDGASLCAAFTQVLEVPLLDQTREGRGELCQQAPNLFSMRFSDPAGDLVVVDGEHVWIYRPSQDSTQVMRASLEMATGGLDLHGEFLDRPGEKYRPEHLGRETVGGHPTHRIGLRPVEEPRYGDATVWIGVDDHLVRRIQIREENGSVRTVELSDIRLGETPPPGTFAFTPPPGVHVIRR